MDSEVLSEHIHELQVSLKDGDDLARAIGLIGDALERRMERLRRSLDGLHDEVEASERDRLLDVIGRVAATLDTYEERLEDRRERMAELVQAFQSSLSEQADALNSLQARLGEGHADQA